MAGNYASAKKPRKSSQSSGEPDVVKEVRDRLQSAWEYDRENRQEAATDLRFLANDQWEPADRSSRSEAGRPYLTINVLDKFLRQVTNPVREADLSVKVAPVDDKGDPELAKIYNGLLRQIQDASSAHAVYAHTVECQAACGIGHHRVCRDYLDEDSFEQSLYIERIDNPLSVFWDPAARSPDRSDAKWCIVTEMWPVDAFKEKWPGKAEEGIDRPSDTTGNNSLSWGDKDVIRVAEYFKKVPKKRTIAKTQGGQVIDVTGWDEKKIAKFGSAGDPIAAMRESEGYTIEKYFVSGTEILEGPYEELGKYIPIIPAVGAEIPLENGVYRQGVVRRARDSQKLYNMNRTSIAEWTAQAPKAPWLATDKMIASHRAQWATANVTSRNVLVYTPDERAPGARPERIQPPAMPAALIQDTATCAEDIKGTIGIYDASLGSRSNETSGVAIRGRQAQGETATYHFVDNFKLCLEHTGRVLVDLIPKVYDSERALRITGDDNKEFTAQINQVMRGEDGIPVIVNDLSVAKFDVRVSIGPSYATRRAEAAASLSEMQRNLPPQQAMLISDLVVGNEDFPGADEAAKRLRATVPENIANYDPDNPPPPAPPDPQVMAKLHEIISVIEKNMAQTELYRSQAYNQLIQADIADGTADGMISVPQVNGGQAQSAPPPQAQQPAQIPPPGGLPQ